MQEILAPRGFLAGLSTKPPIADMCSARVHVCFGPKADIIVRVTREAASSVIPVLYQYKCIGCSPGRYPDTQRMGSASWTGSRDTVHGRYLYISVWRSEPRQTIARRDRHRVHLAFPHSVTKEVRRVPRQQQTIARYVSWPNSL